jgi:CBS domain-containing protein
VTTLREIMTTEVFVTAQDVSVSDVAAAMLRGRFGSAVVSTGATLLGIVTERDVLRAAASAADLSSARVSEWMTPDPVTAAPDTDADDAVEIMMSNGFRHLPVMDAGRLVGIVSLRDVVRTRLGRTTSGPR